MRPLSLKFYLFYISILMKKVKCATIRARAIIRTLTVLVREKWCFVCHLMFVIIWVSFEKLTSIMRPCILVLSSYVSRFLLTFVSMLLSLRRGSLAFHRYPLQLELITSHLNLYEHHTQSRLHHSSRQGYHHLDVAY